jgi:hypothetical protein
MPSTSKKQHNFMAAVASNPKFAKKVGVKSSIGEEFMKADKGRKFRTGGLKEVDTDSNPGLSKLPTEVRNKMGYMNKGGEAKAMVKKEVEFMKKKGAPKSMVKHEMAEAKGMCYGGKVKKMAAGGMTKHEDIKLDKKIVKKAVGMHEKQLHAGKKSDMSKLKSGGMACAPKKMARGGGIEMKGKTKGTMVKMRKGGGC